MGSLKRVSRTGNEGRVKGSGEEGGLHGRIYDFYLNRTEETRAAPWQRWATASTPSSAFFVLAIRKESRSRIEYRELVVGTVCPLGGGDFELFPRPPDFPP